MTMVISFPQNHQLQSENAALKEHTEALSLEKQQLEQKLNDSESAHSEVLHTSVKENHVNLSTGSAVPLVSPQQKPVSQVLLFRAWMTIRFVQ